MSNDQARSLAPVVSPAQLPQMRDVINESVRRALRDAADFTSAHAQGVGRI